MLFPSYDLVLAVHLRSVSVITKFLVQDLQWWSCIYENAVCKLNSLQS